MLRRVRGFLSNFPSLNFKPLQVKCFESILNGPGYYWSLTNWIWQADAISRLHRSRHDKAGTTKVALVKASKHKANRTRQLIRFGWRTETMVLPDHKVAITKQPINTVKLYYSKAITKEGNTLSSQKTLIIFRKTLSWSLLSHNAILHS